MKHGRIVDSAFRPHPLLRSAHAQTIYASLIRPQPALSLRTERLTLADGDFVDLGFAGEGTGPRVVLIHGLSGDFESNYLRGTAQQLMRRGFRCVLFLQRGAGGEPNLLPQSYHHGASHDLREVLAVLKRREPQTPLYAIGWSLGGNVLLKCLGEDGARSPLSAAVAVSAPFRLHECALHLSRGVARLYQNHMLRRLKRFLKTKFHGKPHPPGLDLVAALRARDFIEYDDASTAPLNGFTDALDYYTRSSNGQFLRHIRRPTLILHALDDPFMTADIVPGATELAPDVTLELSRFGGHVGFVAADARGRPVSWAEPHIADFLAEQARGTRASLADEAAATAPA
ncbi:MAG TPA: hydrolase [Nevskiaceae bacterium]|nr:hydrolase [Nevskiaceae bacterium]